MDIFFTYDYVFLKTFAFTKFIYKSLFYSFYFFIFEKFEYTIEMKIFVKRGGNVTKLTYIPYLKVSIFSYGYV